MVLQVRPAKYVPETISYFADFTDQLKNGEVIQGSPTITVYLVDGEDANPSSMLYLGATITGNVVEQRIRQGIAGNIYSIVFSITTDQDHTYENEFYLAILPTEGNAIPNYQPVWLTTFPYPYYWFDSLDASPEIVYGSLLLNPSWSEGLAPHVVSIPGANLYGGAVFYTIPHEDLTSAISIISANLFGGLETYGYAESLLNAAAVINANLYGGAIEYDIPHEDLTASIAIQGATLS